MVIQTQHPTRYPEINQVLEQLLIGVEGELENDFVGLYIHGSLALGDFNLHFDVEKGLFSFLQVRECLACNSTNENDDPRR
jgi:hypothetical protein